MFKILQLWIHYQSSTSRRIVVTQDSRLSPRTETKLVAYCEWMRSVAQKTTFGHEPKKKIVKSRQNDVTKNPAPNVKLP